MKINVLTTGGVVRVRMDLRKNGSGAYDPTAYRAIKNMMKEENRVNFYKGDIIEVEAGEGYAEMLVLQTHEQYATVLKLCENKKLPLAVNCRGLKYADPGMIQYVYNSRVITLIRSLSDEEYEQAMDAVINDLGYGLKTENIQRDQGMNEPEEKEEQKKNQETRDDEMLEELEELEKEVIKADAKAEVYKQMYEKLLSQMMGK